MAKKDKKSGGSIRPVNLDAKTKPQPSPAMSMRAVATSMRHEGPLPTPEDLQAYADVSPDVLPLILDMARAEQEARHARNQAELALDKYAVEQEAALRNKEVDGRSTHVKRSQVLSFTAYMLSLAAFAALTACGFGAVAWVPLTACVFLLVGGPMVLKLKHGDSGMTVQRGPDESKPEESKKEAA